MLDLLRLRLSQGMATVPFPVDESTLPDRFRGRPIVQCNGRASLDLGATPWTTWWRVTLPALRGALFGGGLLAFALSFDEIIVTTFTAGPGLQTLPLWIFQNLFRPNQAPVVNVAAVVLVVISVLPVYLANRLSGGSAGATTK